MTGWQQTWGMLQGTVGTPRDYKTWFKMLHRGLWTPHRTYLAGGAATGVCPCCSAEEGGTIHFLMGSARCPAF